MEFLNRHFLVFLLCGTWPLLCMGLFFTEKSCSAAQKKIVEDTFINAENILLEFAANPWTEIGPYKNFIDGRSAPEIRSNEPTAGEISEKASQTANMILSTLNKKGFSVTCATNKMVDCSGL